MLRNIAGVTSDFFDGLDSLVRNKVPFERIVTALQLASIDLTELTAAARELNEIDERKPFRIETAAQMAVMMNE
jgi:pyruvate-formate lyase-activating enzyme